MNRSISATRSAWLRACASGSFAARFRCTQVLVVVAGIDRHSRRPQLGDRRDHAVREIAVVRDDDDRALVVGQEGLEPFERLDVQVVRGLARAGAATDAGAGVARAPRASATRPENSASGRVKSVGRNRGRRGSSSPRSRAGSRPAPRTDAAGRHSAPSGVAAGAAGRRRELRGDFLHLALDLPDVGEAARAPRPPRSYFGLAAASLREIADGRLAPAG